jgi:predicted RND superfamily exporter protein
MKKINLLALLICACLLMSCLAACSHSNVTVDSNNETSITENESFREQMDIAMKNASKQEVIAKVNDIKITQTQKDVYLISDKNITTDELVRKIIIADYSKKNGLNINSAAKARIDRAKKDMENDNTINEDYCQRTYGISKEAVIDYMTNRSYQIWYEAAFSDMITDEVISGETITKYPQLADAYFAFEKTKNSDPKKAWEEIEQAYYEMIAKDYNIVIY